MKYRTAAKYKLLKQATTLGIFFIWWSIFGIAFPLIGILISGSNVSASSDIVMPIIIFSIIVSFIDGASDFKFFIQNGLSRVNIFVVNLSTTICTSFITAILIYLLSKISYKDLDLSLLLLSKDLYLSSSHWLNILLLSTVILFFSAIGLLFGTLNDMLVGFKKIITLLLIMSIPVVTAILIQLGGDKAMTTFGNVIKLMVGYKDGTLHSPSLIISLFVLTSIFFGILFILNNFREIQRKGA